MKTNQMTDLKKTILAVQGIGNHKKNLNENVNHSSAPQVHVPEPLVEYVTSVIYAAENHLGTQFNAQEINETASYIVGRLQAQSLIESIEAKVGFQLNEDEIHYVFNTLNESI